MKDGFLFSLSRFSLSCSRNYDGLLVIGLLLQRQVIDPSKTTRIEEKMIQQRIHISIGSIRPAW